MSEDDPQKGQDEPKIVVDEDWKAQAEAEKERLAAQERASRPAPAAAPSATNRKEPSQQSGGSPEARELPEASFVTLISTLATQAMLAMGAVQDPRARGYRDLAMAKYHIDTLTMLEAKTAGNLTDEEKSALDNALYQVRMVYVEAAQKDLV